jgi:hypothetical protein
MTPDEYQQTARELARHTAMPEGVAARMETELEQAFEESLAGSNQPPLKPRRSSTSEVGAKAEDPALPLGALAAAAAIVMAIGGAGWWYLRQPPVTSNNVMTAVAPAAPSPTTRRLAEDTSHPSAKTTEAAGKPTVRHRTLPPVIRPAGFVPVPAASRLPQFESGVIVRMALPVGALPSYGVDISPASSDQPVEADVLLGQDGLARAIRLVNLSRSQQ